MSKAKTSKADILRAFREKNAADGKPVKPKKKTVKTKQ